MYVLYYVVLNGGSFLCCFCVVFFFFFQAEDGIRDAQESRGLGDVYKRQPWDGRSKGSLLPIDSYHYIIDLHNGTKPILGTVTIVR